MNEIPFDDKYLLQTLIDLLAIPSPTGRAEPAILYVQGKLRELGLAPERSRKGTLVCDIAGRLHNQPRALTAHVDTLGAMVKEIKANGRLKLTALGSYAWNTVEGEGCTVYTAGDRAIRGSVMLQKASRHVHGTDVDGTKRSADVMEVRLDERTISAAETETLGISVGDYVAFDPRTEVSESGFIRSRHLDDKVCAASLLAAAKALRDAGLSPTQRTTFHFSHYEEAGHGGASAIPSDVAELVAVDMAAVGEGQNSDEFHTTICAKDSGGPYHIELSNHLRELAVGFDIPYRVDIYPYYASDGTAAWRSGLDAQVALVGPGVDASHSYERTHIEALQATTRLLLAYLLSE